MDPSAFSRFLRRRFDRDHPYGLAITLAFLATVGALWAFLAVVDSVTEQDDLFRFDAVAHQTVYGALGPERQPLVWAVTWLGNNATLIAFVVLVAAALLAARKWMLAFRVALASGVGGLVVLGLKGLFHRARPLEQVVPAQGYSLPSGHAFASTVFYGMMVYLVFRLTDRPWARALAIVVGVVLIGAIGLSRVYLNVHYLTDVVAG
ncbi:MAG TPA: phosphatase PAP2 family protein, partial [Rubricoccaceae bacterium]